MSRPEFYNSHIQRIYRTVCEISDAINNGDEVSYAADPKALRWTWHNLANDQKWHVKLNEIKEIGESSIYTTTVLDFINGHKNTVETKKYLEKMAKLKAFA